MKRFAINALAGISLVVCLALVPLCLDRTVILNLHLSSLEFNPFGHMVWWSYSWGDDYNATISFFVEDSRHNGIDHDHPNDPPGAYLRLRAQHPNAVWLGAGEPNASYREKVGWFPIFLPTGLAAIMPTLWIILRVRERRASGKSSRRNRPGTRGSLLYGRARRLMRIFSLVAFSIFAIFWVISLRGWDVEVDWLWPMHTEPGQGCMTLLVRRFSPAEWSEVSGRWYWVPPANRTVDPSQTGFHYERVLPTPPTFFMPDGNEGTGAASTEPIGYSVRVPYWMLCLTAGIFPGWEGLVRLGRRRTARYRNKHGLCARCGYDLQATPTRCPECGELAMPDGKACGK